MKAKEVFGDTSGFLEGLVLDEQFHAVPGGPEGGADDEDDGAAEENTVLGGERDACEEHRSCFLGGRSGYAESG